jgi:hypothetical protein
MYLCNFISGPQIDEQKYFQICSMMKFVEQNFNFLILS